MCPVRSVNHGVCVLFEVSTTVCVCPVRSVNHGVCVLLEVSTTVYVCVCPVRCVNHGVCVCPVRSVKAIDKRDGGGAHNWGSYRDDDDAGLVCFMGVLC